ncbi:MAG: biotin/lipoyl-containing protein [Thermoanaerobaculia bacterium]|nr:biotin/lipoyl-containing protein [Thermoanaerobaculia bacterium]
MKRVAVIEGKRYEVVVERRGEGFHLTIDGRSIAADLATANDSLDTLRIDGGRQYAVVHHRHRDRHEVFFPNFRVDLDMLDPLALASAGAGDDAGSDEQTIRAVMPGRVVRIAVDEGDTVEKGSSLVVVEAMKMENAIEAPRAGKVVAIHVEAGTTVDGGADLITIE